MVGKGQKVEPQLKVALLTREYPPEVYGGAGVHVEYLARELARLVELTVHCWGGERADAGRRAGGARLPALGARSRAAPAHAAALEAVSVDLAMAAGVEGAELVHSHTWYANLAGHLAKLLYGIPHVATVHSLEPMRPWKEEQLGGGYAVSSFCERTALEAADAIIAVSREQARDVLACYPAVDPARVSVIYNGIDSERYRPDAGTDALARHGVDAAIARSSSFVGRITRQKGVTYALDAALQFAPGAQFVLCAGAPDTPEIAAEIEAKVERVRAARRRHRVDREHAAARGRDPDPQPRDRLPLPVDLRAARASSTSRRWPARRRSSRRAPAASPRSSRTARPVCSSRSSRATTARATPSIPARFARDIAERVNALLADSGAGAGDGGGRPARAPSSGSRGRRSRAETAALYETLAGGARADRLAPRRRSCSSTALGRSRLVLMNEAHSGLARCLRTRELGRELLPVAHVRGVRHLAMEALSVARGGARERRARARAAKPGWLSRPAGHASADRGGARARLDAARLRGRLRLGPARDGPEDWTAINWREDQQARNLGAVVSSLPPSRAMLGWCGNGHLSRQAMTAAVDGERQTWTPMGSLVGGYCGVEPFAIDQTVTVGLGRRRARVAHAAPDVPHCGLRAAPRASSQPKLRRRPNGSASARMPTCSRSTTRSSSSSK